MEVPPSRRFKKKNRLLNQAEFDRVFKAPCKQVTSKVVLLAAPNATSDSSRLGLIVSRRVGNAVQRNRVKRRLREIFRQCPSSLVAGNDVVVIARHTARSASFEDLRKNTCWALNAILRKQNQHS